LTAIAAWFLASCVTLVASAQQARLAREGPPYYTHTPVLVRIVGQEFEESPQPTVKCESAPADVRIELQSVAPKISLSMQTIRGSFGNGSVTTREDTVVWQFDFRVTAARPGEYQIGPFTVEQGSRKVRVEAVSFAFGEVPIDPDMRVELVLPDKPMYPDQRVPVTVRWLFAGDPETIDSLSIHSPLFDQFRFAPDGQPTRQSAHLPIETKDGQVVLSAKQSQETVDGKEYIVVSATRTLIPSQPGKFSLDPIVATLRKVKRWRRSSPFDDFGFGNSMMRELMGEGRRADETELGRAIGSALSLVVSPFPEKDRPASFAGAVGPGFSLEVSADRTVVHVGDPISLTVAVQGAGNIENVSLPSLSADGGMDSRQFRISQSESTGALEKGVKRFTVTTRVENESVSEIPAIAFSWFDPSDAKYHTTHSKPIALRVLPAKIVSAGDVVSREPAKKSDSANGKTKDLAKPAAGAASNEAAAGISLSGADLALERRPEVLLPGESRAPSRTLVDGVLYLGGIAVLLLAVISRRRRAIPAEELQRRQRVRRNCRVIQRARNRPQRQAVALIAEAMRSLTADHPEVDRAEADAVIAQCEAVLYAPESGPDKTVNDELVSRAIAAAQQIVKGSP
jgi:hypothetical protein